MQRPMPYGCPEAIRNCMPARSRRPIVFRAGLRTLAARAVPIHGECGGYMVLGRGIEDADGVRHEMTGLLGLETSFARRRLHLGYRRARLQRDCSLGAEGAEVFGHEYHYASTVSVDGDSLVDCRDASGVERARTRHPAMARRLERFFMSSTRQPPHDRDARSIAAAIRRSVSRDISRSHSLASRRPPLSP